MSDFDCIDSSIAAVTRQSFLAMVDSEDVQEVSIGVHVVRLIPFRCLLLVEYSVEVLSH